MKLNKQQKEAIKATRETIEQLEDLQTECFAALCDSLCKSLKIEKLSINQSDWLFEYVYNNSDLSLRVLEEKLKN